MSNPNASLLSEKLGGKNASSTPTYSPSSNKMWSDGYHSQHSSLSSSDQYSAPPFSPRSSVAGGAGRLINEEEDDRDDDALSQASGSTAFSLAEPPAHQNEGMPGHVRILSQDRYEPPIIDNVEYHHEAPIDIKPVPMVLSNTTQPPAPVPESVQDRTSILLDRLRLADGAPNSPPLTARAIDHSQQQQQQQQQKYSSPSTSEQVPTSKGPLQQQLLSVLSKLEILESQSPTIMASEYAELQSRITQLEADKADLLAKRESFFALRDEDVSNLVRVRTLLAQERRAHEEIRRLRDEDLQKVIDLRNKLAQAVWANQASSAATTITARGHSHSSASSISMMAGKRIDKTQQQSISMQGGGSTNSTSPNTDLWQAAKTAALEQRVLELESANAKLREKLEEREQRLQLQKSLPLVAAAASQTTTSVLISGGGGDHHQPHQPGLAAFAELSLYAMREKESCKAELADMKVENSKLTQQVEGLKAKLESSQAVLGYFAQMVKVR